MQHLKARVVITASQSSTSQHIVNSISISGNSFRRTSNTVVSVRNLHFVGHMEAVMMGNFVDAVGLSIGRDLRYVLHQRLSPLSVIVFFNSRAKR